MKVFNGIKNLLGSKKGTMSLLILGSCTAGVVLGNLDGTSYAVVVGIIQAIYNYTAYKTDVAYKAKDQNEKL
jgi:hypothetical protein